jgi:hypothetical protein
MRARSLSKMMAGTMSSHGISHGGQRGGLDPLRRLPPFKYTTSEKRKAFVGTLYPYADYLLQCTQGVEGENYEYDGPVMYTEMKQVGKGMNSKYIHGETKIGHFKTSETINIKTGIITKSKGKMFYFGGSVYELYNMKYGSSVDLHRYCDPTGDVDIQMWSPPIESVEEIGPLNWIPFQHEGQLNPYYDSFCSVVYNSFLENLNRQTILSKIPGIVAFNINEYTEIPEESKLPNLGYKAIQLPNTNFWVVGFITSNMYKIQLVCKVEENGVVEIDHIIEFIISFSEDNKNSEYDIFSEDYKIPETEQLTIGSSVYKVHDINNLRNANIEAYKIRRNMIDPSNIYHEDVHKAYNHIARLLYLYELLYQNPRKFKLSYFHFILNIDPLKPTIVDPYYYKIIDGEFYRFQIDVRYLLNAYISIVKQYFMYRSYQLNPLTKVDGRNYFIINDRDADAMKSIHDEFLARLFNDERFPNDNLTFFEETVASGKKRRKTMKRKTNKKSTKKHNIKRRKTRKHKSL